MRQRGVPKHSFKVRLESSTRRDVCDVLRNNDRDTDLLEEAEEMTKYISNLRKHVWLQC